MACWHCRQGSKQSLMYKEDMQSKIQSLGCRGEAWPGQNAQIVVQKCIFALASHSALAKWHAGIAGKVQNKGLMFQEDKQSKIQSLSYHGEAWPGQNAQIVVQKCIFALASHSALAKWHAGIAGKVQNKALM